MYKTPYFVQTQCRLSRWYLHTSNFQNDRTQEHAQLALLLLLKYSSAFHFLLELILSIIYADFEFYMLYPTILNLIQQKYYGLHLQVMKKHIIC